MKNLMKRFLLACLLTIGLLGAQWPGAAYAQTTTANVETMTYSRAAPPRLRGRVAGAET